MENEKNIIEEYEIDVLVSKALSLMYAANAEKFDENNKPFSAKTFLMLSKLMLKSENKKLWLILLLMDIVRNELYSFDDLEIFGNDVKDAVSILNKKEEKENDLVTEFKKVSDELE